MQNSKQLPLGLVLDLGYWNLELIGHLALEICDFSINGG